jgi:predicted RNase H-like HicB family nuclease
MQYTVVLEAWEAGGYTARCVEIPTAICWGENKGEALARLKDIIGMVREVQQEDLQKTIQSVHAEIIKIDMADSA